MLHIGQGYRAGFHSLFSNPQRQLPDGRWVENPASQYVVYKDGSIEQWVEEDDAAWHAGQANSPDPLLSLEGRNPNRLYIGIEHEGFTGEPWTEEMMQADLWLLRQIRERWGIEYNENNLIGHYRIDSINRRNCPGTGCPFERLLAELNQGV